MAAAVEASPRHGDGPGAALTLRNLPWPTPWADVFGRGGELCVEIGFGRGQFLLDLARRRPEANVVGVEVSNRSLVAAEEGARKASLSNVRVVHATGQSALAHLFDEASIAAVYVHFPDPWFKTRHAHRRLLAPATVALIASRLAPGGALHAATDVAAYALEIDRALAAADGLRNAADARWRSERDEGVATKYETLARAAGRDCAYFTTFAPRRCSRRARARGAIDAARRLAHVHSARDGGCRLRVRQVSAAGATSTRSTCTAGSARS
ncbi:MAG: tRNA (guanosine(46)-N7)-methyltransferase TrmB [Anaerolineae bacterium]